VPDKFSEVVDLDRCGDGGGEYTEGEYQNARPARNGERQQERFDAVDNGIGSEVE
jgi:hypothetical protein